MITNSLVPKRPFAFSSIQSPVSQVSILGPGIPQHQPAPVILSKSAQRTSRRICSCFSPSYQGTTSVVPKRPLLFLQSKAHREAALTSSPRSGQKMIAPRRQPGDQTKNCIAKPASAGERRAPTHFLGTESSASLRYATSKITSSSIGIPSGRLATPMTERTANLSPPNTSRNRSDAPSATLG
jgi:hypothetical protein